MTVWKKIIERKREKHICEIWTRETHQDSEFDPCEIFHYGPQHSDWDEIFNCLFMKRIKTKEKIAICELQSSACIIYTRSMVHCILLWQILLFLSFYSNSYSHLGHVYHKQPPTIVFLLIKYIYIYKINS